MNTAQMFKLIDSVLFFEACLYHQVLPLALENNRLLLGMVNPEDSGSLNYIKRILSHMNCSLVPLPMAADTHREMLSAYLSYREKSKTVIQPQPVTNKRSLEPKAKEDIHNRPTLILTETETDQSTEPEPANNFSTTTKAHNTADRPKAESVPSKVTVQTNSGLLVLNVEATHQSSPIEVLATLPPKNLLQELLARVLIGGIGRLYFERQQGKTGRIIWSQDGVLKSTLEKLSLSVFQATIDELKRLTHLPLTPVEVRTLVEVYCLYRKNRLLLRFQVMPGEYGEQATLQVLRGAALKFYQQQQLSYLSRDALAIARQLLGKVNELQKRTQLSTNMNSEQLELPEDLNQLLASLSEINETAQAAANLKENNENTLS